MKRAAILILVLAALSGCVTRQRCDRKFPAATLKDSVYTKDSIVEKIVPVYVTDSSGLRALLECDSLGNVRVKEIEDYYAGRLIEKPKIEIRDKYIYVKCEIDSGAVMVKLLEKYIKQVRVVVIQKPPVMKMNGVQTFLAWTGGVSLAGLFLFLLLAIFRTKKKFI